MFCFCYNANALTEKTKEDDSKNIPGAFVENQDVFYEKINSVMAKKQIDKTITKYLKILILIVIGALMITLTIMLYTQVIRPNLADRASTMISQAPHVEYSIET